VNKTEASWNKSEICCSISGSAKILDKLQAFVKMVGEIGKRPCSGWGGDPRMTSASDVGTETSGKFTRPGIYARGAETVDLILKAALDVLIDEGASAFTLRRIAARCDMKVGNLSYHFARKEMLINLMLDDLLDYYERLLDELIRRPGLDPETQFCTMVEICLDDIGSKRTTHLFTELWALSNHNEFVADRVAAFYRSVHGQWAAAIRPLNPRLSAQQADSVARFISASLEGTTIFAGHGKAWAAQMPEMKAIAIKSLLHLAKTITPGDIDGIG
jgi:AcrR family transcriptional regulator